MFKSLLNVDAEVITNTVHKGSSFYGKAVKELPTLFQLFRPLHWSLIVALVVILVDPVQEPFLRGPFSNS